MSIIAELSYSTGPKVTGKVVDYVYRGDGRRLVVEKFSEFDTRYNTLTLKPDRLDNWNEIKDDVQEHILNGDVETTDSSKEVTDVNTVYYSCRMSSKWVGLDADLNVVTKKYDTHKELKEDHGAVGVTGHKDQDVDGDEKKVYTLAIPPNKR